MLKFAMVLRSFYFLPRFLCAAFLCLFGMYGGPCTAQVNTQGRHDKLRNSIRAEIDELKKLPNKVREADAAGAEGPKLLATLSKTVADLKKDVSSPDAKAALGEGKAPHSVGWYCEHASESFSKLGSIAKQMNEAANQFSDELKKISLEREDSIDRLTAYTNQVVTSLKSYVTSPEKKQVYSDFKDIRKNLPPMWNAYQIARARKNTAAADAAKLKHYALVLQDVANLFEECKTKRSLLENLEQLKSADQTGYNALRTEVDRIACPTPNLATHEMISLSNQFYGEAEKHSKDISASFEPLELETRDCPNFDPKKVDEYDIGARSTIKRAFDKINQAFEARAALIVRRQQKLQESLQENAKSSKDLEQKIVKINAEMDKIPSPNTRTMSSDEYSGNMKTLNYWRGEQNKAQQLKIDLMKNTADINKLIKGCEDQNIIVRTKSSDIKSIHGQLDLAGVSNR